MAHHDLYSWLVLATGAAGVLTVAGGVIGFVRRVASERRTQAEAFFVYTDVSGIPDDPPEERQVKIVLNNGSNRIVSQLVLLHDDVLRRRSGLSSRVGTYGHGLTLTMAAWRSGP